MEGDSARGDETKSKNAKAICGPKKLGAWATVHQGVGLVHNTQDLVWGLRKEGALSHAGSGSPWQGPMARPVTEEGQETGAPSTFCPLAIGPACAGAPSCSRPEISRTRDCLQVRPEQCPEARRLRGAVSQNPALPTSETQTSLQQVRDRTLSMGSLRTQRRRRQGGAFPSQECLGLPHSLATVVRGLGPLPLQAIGPAISEGRCPSGVLTLLVSDSPCGPAGSDHPARAGAVLTGSTTAITCTFYRAQNPRKVTHSEEAK